MANENDKKGGDFDLDWDDALADWEKDVEGGAVAQSGPMPQRPSAPTPAPTPGRALYQPPDPNEIARLRGGRPAAPTPAAPAKPPEATPSRSAMQTAPPPAGGHDPFDLDDDDDGSSTRVASIPKDLIARITGTGGPSGGGEMAPPEPARTSAVDLDIDGLLEGFEGETRAYPAELPRVVRPLKPDSVAPVAPVAPKPAAPAPAPKAATPVKPGAPPAPPLPAPPLPAEPRSAATELARAVARAAPKPGAAAPPRPPMPAPPRPGVPVPSPGGKPLVAPPRPVVPPPGGARPVVPPVVPPPIVAPPVIAPAPAAADDSDIDALLSGLDDGARAPAAPVPAAAPAPRAPAATLAASPKPVVAPPPAALALDEDESEAESAFFAKAEPQIAGPRKSLEDELDDLMGDAPVSTATPVPAPTPAAPPAAEAAPAPKSIEMRALEAGRADPKPSIADRLAGLSRAKRELDVTKPVALEGHAPKAAAPVVAPPTPLSTPLGAPTPVPPRPDADEPVIAAGDDEPVIAAGDDEPVIAAGDDEPVIAADDDEPVIAAGDDDEPVIAAGDDDEPVIAAGDDADLSADEAGSVSFEDEDAPPPAEAPKSIPPPLPSRSQPPAAPAAEAPRPDRGAQAARRTVRSRKPRMEMFPLVGRDEAARRAQIDLLTRLSERAASPVQKARALAGAADVAGVIGDHALARELRARAETLDPKDPLGLRFARRSALARGAWDEVRTALRAEADLAGSGPYHALTLAALAELEMGPLADPAAAHATARRAHAAAPTSMAAALVLHDTASAVGEVSSSVFEALAHAAAEGGADHGASKQFAHEHLRALARSGQLGDAIEGDDLETALVRVRAARRAGDDAGLAVTLAALAEKVAPEIADLARRGAAQATARSGEPAAALAHLTTEAPSLPSLRTTARIAARARDTARELAALRALAAATAGADRAGALARIADLAVDAGDLDAAEAALRDAALADSSLGTLRMVRERIVRKDPARATRGDGTEGALALSAKLAIDPNDAVRELELLDKARTEDDALVTADVLSLDAALGVEPTNEDRTPANDGISREIERTPADARTPLLVALADRANAVGLEAAAETALREARSLSPGEALVTRELARLLAPRAPREAAALWLEEASAAPDERAAFAASVAGRLLEGDAAVSAYRRALDARRQHAPSIDALERIARTTGDAKLLEDALERGLTLPTTPLDRAAQLVRLGLVRSEDAAAAARAFEQARELAPEDPVLVDLALRLGEALSPAQRADLVGQAAAHAPAALAETYRLIHAYALEEAGELAAAAEALAPVVGEGSTAARAAMRTLDRVQLAAGDLASVGERRFAALRATSPEEGGDSASHVRALEALASLDLDVRRDASAAAASLAAIVELRPQHVPALRALERNLMETDRGLELAAIEEQLAKAGIAPSDATGQLRHAVRLRLAPADAPGTAADEAVLSAQASVHLDAWTLRRVVAAAHAKGDFEGAAKAEKALAEALAAPIERATIALRAATSELRARLGEPIAAAKAAAVLAPFVAEARAHGPAWEALGELREQAGEHAAAVEALDVAAQASAVPGRKVVLFHRAAVLASDRADDEERALAMLEAAAEIDVAFADVFERSRAILERKGDRAKLSELVRRRAAAGGDGAMLVELHLAEASLREADQDAEGAKAALRAALAIAPERLEALRKLANLSLEGEDYRSAADALIRIARIRKDREELRWVFFTLGDIYDKHIPDPKRAEAAFLRVLKLDAEDLPSMERLAALYQRESQHPQAADMLEKLTRAEGDPDKVRQHQLALARVLETSGDARKAEQVLEAARRTAPTELETLRALADFYGRQKAQTALAMHLNRAVADFRHALVTDLADSMAWLGLVEVLDWRGKKDAARAAASAASAMGVVDVEIGRLLDPHGAAPGAGMRGADGDLDDVFAPAALNAPTRAVFRALGPTLEKVLPFDPRTLRAEKLGPKDTSLRPIALEIGRWMGLPDVEIWLAPTAGRVCMPVSSQPVGIVVGRDLLTIDERERAFLLARAIRVAKSGLGLGMRTQPAELAALLAGLVLNFDPHYMAMGVDPALVQDFQKRVARQLPRRAQEEFGPVVFEMAGSAEYDPSKLPLAISELGDRAALLMTGNVPAALSALLKLAGEGTLPADPHARAALVRKSAEAAALVSFAISDPHFEARARAGLS